MSRSASNTTPSNTQWILGLRPEHHGLRVDPCLPADWEGFRATRRLRGATYEIEVRKPRGAGGQVSRLEVDGRPLDGNLVPLAPAGTTVEVLAVIDGG